MVWIQFTQLTINDGYHMLMIFYFGCNIVTNDNICKFIFII